MSDRIKGARKAKNDGRKFALEDSFTLGGKKIKAAYAIATAMAVVYAILQIGAALTESRVSVIITELLFLVFLAFAYLARADIVKGLKKFEHVAYIFLGLSILSLLWKLVITYIIADTSSFGNVSWTALVCGFNTVVSVIVIAGLVYMENIPLDKLYLKIGDNKGIILGGIGFILCLIFALVGAYLLSNGATGKLPEIAAVVIVFGIILGILEEVWFRGLLLSQSVPILGESYGNIFQAVVFGIFEAQVFVALMANVSYMMVIFFVLIGAMLGYYWGRATMKTGSLLSSMLLHAGLYILILLPLIASSVA